MLIVTYPKDDTFLARAPFVLQLEGKLLHLDRLLDDPKLILKVSNDLMHSAPQAAWNGRPATPVVVTLRCAVARALMGWSYATAHAEIAGSVKWRWFCRIYDYAVPNHSTLQAREALIRPSTLQHLHRRVVQLAQAAGVTQGKQLRTDGTVIETNIHYPTDSHLLSDSVRVLGRLLGQARRVLKPQTAPEKKRFGIAVGAPITWRAKSPMRRVAKKDKNKRKKWRSVPIGS